jgi:hypothetical protein
MGYCNDAGVSHITGGNFAQSATQLMVGYVISFGHKVAKLFNHTVQHYLRMV